MKNKIVIALGVMVILFLVSMMVYAIMDKRPSNNVIETQSKNVDSIMRAGNDSLVERKKTL